MASYLNIRKKNVLQPLNQREREQLLQDTDPPLPHLPLLETSLLQHLPLLGRPPRPHLQPLPSLRPDFAPFLFLLFLQAQRQVRIQQPHLSPPQVGGQTEHQIVQEQEIPSLQLQGSAAAAYPPDRKEKRKGRNNGKKSQAQGNCPNSL